MFYLLSSPSASADLQITGVPGFTFSDTPGGRPTVANLNRALRFTYLVSGTIGGTNAGLAAGSINVSHFASGVGGSNIMVTAGGLVVSNNAIGPNQLSTAAAGAGLGGGGGSALVINCDSNTIINTGDVISVGTGLSNVNVSANAAIAVSKLAFNSNTIVGATLNGTNGNLVFTNYFVSTSSNTFEPLRFVTGTFTVAAGSSNSVAHGLGATPELVRWVLVCTNAEDGYLAGDEIDVASVTDAATQRTKFSYGANSTNVFCTVAAGASFNYPDKSDGSYTTLTTTNWRLKGYARR